MIDGTLDSSGLRGKMRKLISNVRDPNLMKKVAGMMHDSVETNFEKEGRPRWKRRSPVTTRSKVKRGKLGKILESSGILRLSIFQKHTVTTATVGTNLKYAAIHEKGSKQFVSQKQRWWLGMNLGLWMKVGAKIEIPARPFMNIPRSDLNKIKKRIGLNLTKGVR